jgi:hypothetical protein
MQIRLGRDSRTRRCLLYRPAKMIAHGTKLDQLLAARHPDHSHAILEFRLSISH